MKTIRESTDAVWHYWLHTDILDMDVTDGCAVDCMRIIQAAQVLLDNCVDVDASGVIVVVKEQCEVFYFG